MSRTGSCQAVKGRIPCWSRHRRLGRTWALGRPRDCCSGPDCGAGLACSREGAMCGHVLGQPACISGDRSHR